MAKRTMLMVIGLMVSIFGYSQIKISGKISDLNGIPISFATIKFTKDSKSFGKISDSIGTYVLTLPDTGLYVITVSSFNYRDSISNYNVSQKEQIKDFQLRYGNASELGGVIVSSNRKPLISRKADRYILNVDQSALTKGRNTFEILNYAPGVMTIGNKIAINGNVGTKIMINGKLLRLSGEQVQNYLTNLQADEVESIEIIPVPGAEFDAEGSGGIISIKLKQKRSAGLTGSISVGAKTPQWPTYNTSEQLNYQNAKWQIYGSHNYSKRNSYGKFSDNRMYVDQVYSTNSKSNYDNYSNNYRLGVGYNINKSDYWGVEFNGNTNGGNSTTNSLAQYINDSTKNDYNLLTNVASKSKNSLYAWSTNYQHNIDSLGSYVKLLADYTRANYSQNGSYISKYRNSNNDPLFDSIYRNSVPLKFNNYDISIDIVKKLKNNSEFNAGGKFTQTKTRNDVQYEYQYNGAFYNDTTRSNVFRYTENIAAVYIQYSKEWENDALQLGLRGENTSAKGSSPTTGINFNRNYFGLFPSAFLKHNFDKKNTLSLTYSRRLGRPSYSILNPFELRMDDYTYVKGNPNLKPEYTNSFELSYLFNKKYNLSLFTQLTSGPFGQPLSNNGNEIVTEYLWQNMDHNYNYGANLYVPIKITKWWTTINNFLIYHNIIKWEDENNSKTIMQAKSTQQLNVEKVFNVELSGYYQSSYNIGNLIYVPNYSVDLGITKSIFNDKLYIRILGTDLFNTDRMDYKSLKGSTLKVDARQKYLTRRFSIQLTYNFKVGKKVSITKVESGNESEKNRM